MQEIGGTLYLSKSTTNQFEATTIFPLYGKGDFDEVAYWWVYHPYRRFEDCWGQGGGLRSSYSVVVSIIAFLYDFLGDDDLQKDIFDI